MDFTPLYHGLLGIFGVIGLSAVGVPIVISLATSGLIGLYLTAGPSMALVTLKTMPYAIGSSYTLVVVPLFILMGLIASSAGIMTDLYNSLNK